MSIKVLYEKGVFKPLEKVRGIKEGDIYTKDDIVNKENDAQG